MFWRKRKPSDFGNEIQAHLQLEFDRFREQGLSEQEARLAARRSFGNVARVEERFYESSLWMVFDHLLRDIRFAARVLAKDARFSILAVLGLALGIGVSTAIFALTNYSLRMEAEGAKDTASLVGFNRLIDGRPRGNFTYSEYCYYRDHAVSYRELKAGWERFILAPLRPAAEAEDVQGRFMSANFLSAGGLHPALGRSFSQSEEQTGNPSVAVLDFRFWKRRFAADPSVLGKTVILNARALTIVGVADERFTGNTSDFYLPLGLQPALLQQGDWLHDANQHWLMLEAWLRPGVAARQAQAEMDVLARAPESAKPAFRGDGGVLVTPGGSNPEKRKEMLALVLVVTIAVSMILLIACSNLANLLLARAVVRRREIGVRLALGAGRVRLISQLLTESMLLALAGGVLGLLFSHWLARSLLVAMEPSPGVIPDLTLDFRVILYGAGLSLATAMSFGLGPALAATRTNLSQALHAEGLSGTVRAQGRRIWAPRNLLVIVPLAVSMMLLLGAGIAVRRVQRSYLNGPAFDASRLMGVSFRLNMQGYDETRTRQFQDNLRQRIEVMPGVVSVALATVMPLSNAAGWFPLVVEGAPIPTGDASPHTDYNIISAGYFEAIGAPIVRGRGFAPFDREGGQPVALVNQELARRYWPNEESVGKRIRLAGGGTFFEIVGVAPDLQDATQRFNSVRPMVYVPYAQAKLFLHGMRTDPPPYQMQFLIRTNGATAGVKAALRQETLATDSTLRVHIQTIQEMLEARVGPMRTISMLLSALGALALLMASVGIYAILAYAVSQRTHEIGIRTALGAQPREILALVMRRTMWLIAWGIGSGLLGSLALTRILSRSIAKFGELDAATCVSVSVLLGAVAVLANYLPARKALRVDPVQALRCE